MMRGVVGRPTFVPFGLVTIAATTLVIEPDGTWVATAHA
jgi:hypothetical protein